MGLSDFIKTVKKIFTGDDGEYEDDYRFRKLDDDSSFEKNDYSSKDDIDLDNDDEIGGLTEAEASRFEKALERFMMKLPEKERESEDVEELIDDVTERYFARKISDPTKALEQDYQKLKATKSQRNEQKHRRSNSIIEKLKHFEELSEEEQNDLEDWNGKYSINKITKNDLKALAEIAESWLRPENLTEAREKLRLLNLLDSDLMDQLGKIVKVQIVGIDEIPLDELNYQHQLFLFEQRLYSNLLDRVFFYFVGSEKRLKVETINNDYAEYFKNFWLRSGIKPKSIDCDDLIVNRPCYLKKPFTLETPHFHMGKRYFEKDSSQSVMVYLFADKLEFIADGGHYSISLSDIIDISINAWDGERNKSEPNLLEITCRDNHKWLFTIGHNDMFHVSTEDIDLLVLRALIYFFIKNPQ